MDNHSIASVSEISFRSKGIMEKRKIRVGIIGLQPKRSWAAVAHLPGLRRLSDKFEIVGVANRRYESTLAAARECKIPQAFKSVAELVQSPDIDLVTVTVRVPNHKEVLEQALAAGKAIYCEWPLAVDFAEAERLVEMAKQKGVRTFIGTQVIANPQLALIRKVLSEGKIGRVLSHSLIGYGRINGAEITDEATERYLLDKTTGATMLTISVMHTLVALQYVSGKINSFNSLLATARPQIYSRERQGYVPMTAADEAGMQGFLADGSVFSLHYSGGMPYDDKGFLWEIIGSEGTLRISALSGAVQIENLKITLCRKGETAFSEITVSEQSLTGFGQDFIAGNLHRMYVGVWQDILTGSHMVPDFSDALELHRILDRIKATALRKA